MTDLDGREKNLYFDLVVLIVLWSAALLASGRWHWLFGGMFLVFSLVGAFAHQIAYHEEDVVELERYELCADNDRSNRVIVDLYHKTLTHKYGVMSFGHYTAKHIKPSPTYWPALSFVFKYFPVFDKSLTRTVTLFEKEAEDYLYRIRWFSFDRPVSGWFATIDLPDSAQYGGNSDRFVKC